VDVAYLEGGMQGMKLGHTMAALRGLLSPGRLLDRSRGSPGEGVSGAQPAAGDNLPLVISFNAEAAATATAALLSAAVVA